MLVRACEESLPLGETYNEGGESAPTNDASKKQAQARTSISLAEEVMEGAE
jgi:hypothetical protein